MDGREDEVFSWGEVWSVFRDGTHVWLICVPLFFSGVTVRDRLTLCLPGPCEGVTLIVEFQTLYKLMRY